MPNEDSSYRRFWPELAAERVSAAVLGVRCLPEPLRSAPGVLSLPFGSLYSYEEGKLALVSSEVLSGREALADRCGANEEWLVFSEHLVAFCKRNKVSRLFFDNDGLDAEDGRAGKPVMVALTTTVVGTMMVDDQQWEEFEEAPDAYATEHREEVIWDARTAHETMEICQA